MKKFITFLSLLFLCCLSLSAAEVVIDGIKYTLQKDNTVSCKAVKKDALVDVELPASVRLNGIDYYLGGIADNGFADCKNLKSIVIPNTVKKFGKYAFENCPNLESVVMPDDAVATIAQGNYGVGNYGIFRGCKKLANVSGHGIPYPKYVVYDAFYGCDDTPFYKTIVEEGSTELTSRTFQPESFSTFAESRLKRTVEDWQIRKSYETQAQWEARVNDESRNKYIEQTLASLKLEYLNKYTPKTLKGKLQEYVRDFEFFPIELNNQAGTVYASVPKNEQTKFAENWSKTTIQPVYGILDDMPAVLSCKFITPDDKEYTSARSYGEDDFTPLVINITPLAAVKEYEKTLLADNGKVNIRKDFVPDAVDINIPVSDVDNKKTFAVIIGNEHYQRVAPVDFAANDARIFEQYCEKTLGIPSTNIRTYFDATYGDIRAAMRDIRDIASAYNGDIRVIFYYAGHGVPDESNRNAYILPIDAEGNDLASCYPLSNLYDELSALNAESVLALIDACFSGSVRGDGMLASARGIKLKPRSLQPKGKLIVLSACFGDQSALPYDEKGHGIFTYYLLNKLNDSKGDINLGELSDYLSEEVARQSVVVNRKLQTPTVNSSPELSSTWRDIRLK
ncbi:MAG: caspase family protein [Duncaniella sp.]|nr:caspase family protein [Duncaniella sp.]